MNNIIKIFIFITFFLSICLLIYQFVFAQSNSVPCDLCGETCNPNADGQSSFPGCNGAGICMPANCSCSADKKPVCQSRSPEMFDCTYFTGTYFTGMQTTTVSCSQRQDCFCEDIIACTSDSDCDDNDSCTTDTCVNPGTTSSYCSNKNNPVNGGWSSWGPCVNGIQTRTCTNPSPSCGGAQCSGPSSQSCSSGITCSANSDCDDSNSCTTDTCVNPGTTSSYCSNKNNPVNGGWSSWGPCVNGIQTRTCTNPSPSCGGAQCSGPSSQSCSSGITCSANSDCDDSNSCTTDTCVNPGTTSSYCSNKNNPVNGGWSSWGPCVNGIQTRTCTNPSPSCGGAQCSGPSSQSCSSGITCSANSDCDDSNSCTTDTCVNPGTTSSYCSNKNNPVNGGWSSWGPCVNGIQTRTCTNPSPSCGGAQCSGPSSQSCSSGITCSANSDCDDSNSCTTDTCVNPGTTSSYCSNKNNPVNGGWSSWGPCVNGIQTRTCTNPSPSCGGAQCSGPSSQSCSSGITCSADSDCDDSNSCTTDTCKNPGTPSSYCTNSAQGNHLECRNNTCTSVSNTASNCSNSCTVGPPDSCISQTYRLTVNKSGTGSGVVTSSPPGINCDSICKQDDAYYASGTSVTLYTAPSQGSIFSDWKGDCFTYGTNPTCQITMNQDKNVIAVFNSSQQPPPPPPPPPPLFILTVSINPSGSGIVNVNPPNNNISLQSTFSYPTSTNVTLSVVSSSPGYVFQGWQEDCSSFGTSSICQIIVNGIKNVIAVFKTRGTIREIIPFNPPSLNQFIKQTASIFLGWR